MIDWAQFREAIAAGLPNAERLARLRRLESWLELPPGGALAALEEELKTTPPLPIWECVVLLNLTILREAGIQSGAEFGPALQRLYDEVQQGTASEERKKAAAQLAALWELRLALLQKDPTLSQPPSDAAMAKMHLQQAATALFKRLDAVENQLAPGTVSELAIKTYENIVREAEALAASAEPGNGALPYVFYMIASAERTLAGCYAIVGRNSDALQSFAAAAEDFEKAGEPEKVEDCQRRATDLQTRLLGNLDAAVENPLADLNAAAPGGGSLTPPSPQAQWERIEALMKLTSVEGEAADTFAALQNANTAAKELVGLGYPDPATCTAETAMDSWLQTSVASFKGTELLRRASHVNMYYDGILGARLALLFEKDPAVADKMLALQTELQKLSERMMLEANAATTEGQRAFERYSPLPPEPAHEKENPKKVDFETNLDRMRAVDAALNENQKLCNQRASAGDGMDDLLASVEKLEAEADTLNSPVHEAATRLGHAYILLQLGRGAELGPLAREARRRLLAGRAPSLSSLPLSYERYYFLDSLKRETMGCIMTGDFEGALKLCEETIRDFETERYRVSSEYRQSALLSWVSEFYTWAAFSAFKLQRWDNMLEAIDLIKARSAIRSRLMPDAPQNLNSNLQQEFEALDAALQKDPKNEDLKTRRRQLWDLLSIARAQSGASAQVPALSVASLQSALEEDEALIGYFWLAETVILTIAVDRERFHAERISLKPEELTRLQEFVAFVQTLKSSQKMDRTVEKLGAILLPDFLRDFMKAKKRVIFSPHHSLHLFPFHAARWGTDAFVGTEFAVSYAPNFCSVLLPWAQPVENRVLAMGIRDFADKTVQSLENVEDDAAAIAAYYRANGAAVELALGTEATRERIEALRNQGKLQQFRCVHLGTHGLSVFETPDQPLESRLLVQDGTLDAMDIANLRLSAELVMLSACHSGQRAIQLRNLGEVPGDDIFGLQSALFRSGVRAIVGTLWLVETSSSSPIVRGFHKHYAEGKPAEVALQLAVKEYLENPVDSLTGVYYWAPYFISFIGRRQTKEGDSWKN